MRISDWSSDVCSSDLIRPPSQQMRHSRDQIVESLIVIKAADKADDVRAIESKLRSQTGVGRDGSAEHVHVNTIWGYDALALRHAPGEQILLQTSENDRNCVGRAHGVTFKPASQAIAKGTVSPGTLANGLLPPNHANQ